MPRVSLKLMAGAAWSMVVASARSLREVRRLTAAEIAARWTDGVQGRGSGGRTARGHTGVFTEEHSNSTPRWFFHLDKQLNTVYRRAAARGGGRNRRAPETFWSASPRPCVLIHPRLTLIRLRALISWSRTPSQYTSAAARADIEQ
jgi:hypothetical protein